MAAKNETAPDNVRNVIRDGQPATEILDDNGVVRITLWPALPLWMFKTRRRK